MINTTTLRDKSIKNETILMAAIIIITIIIIIRLIPNLQLFNTTALNCWDVVLLRF